MHPRWTALWCAARRTAAAVVLTLAALLAGGAASALAGPGITIKQGVNSPTKLISGGQIAGAADTSGTYTLRDRPGDPGQPVSVSGLSIRGLLSLAGYNPGAIRFVQVVGGDGSVITLNSPEINSPPFPEGPALVTDEGAGTRFIKPSRTSGGASQSVLSVPGTPLEMTVEGSSLLSLRASASPTKVGTGQTVTFKVSVRFQQPASYAYEWDFGDGASASGSTVTHKYTQSGDLTARVTVRGSAGSTAECASVCEGTATVRVTVTGKEREGPLGTEQGGGGATSLGGTGTGGTGSGTGSGGGGTDNTEFGAYPTPAKRKPAPTKPQRPESHEPFSSDPTSGEGKTIVQGVLLAGAGQTIKGALSKGAPAGNPKPRQGTQGTPADSSMVGPALALTLAIMALGALRERRRVRLRLA